jgi:hypothetical protein
VVGCLGVEEYPFAFTTRTDAEVEQLRGQLLAQHGGEEAVLNMLGYTLFGKAVKLLCPKVSAQSVEDPVLRAQAEQLHDAFIEERLPELLAALLKQKAQQLGTTTDKLTIPQYLEVESLARKQAGEEFGSHPINTQRDGPMLTNLMALWKATGFDKAAILNVGSKHIDRIKLRLPADVRYMVISQP